MTPPPDSKRYLLPALVGCLVFTAICATMAGFVLDDAYITYRYARHLALHGTLEWNPGADPVEGYTSFLWVVLNAGAIAAGFDPVAFSKAVALVSGWALIILLARECRTLSWPLGLAVVSGVALNPAMALLAMQGMETVPATLLVTSAAVAALRAGRHPGAATLAALHGLTFVAFLARPDTAAFTGVMLAAIAFSLLLRRRWIELRRHVAAGAALGLALAVYMGWRVSYFGYFFPNTFYIKSALAGTEAGRSGGEYLAGFVLEFAWPYLLAMAAVLFAGGRSGPALPHAPLLAGVASFGVYVATITPIQGAAWRFVLPVLPVILLVAGRAAAEHLDRLSESWRPARRHLAAAALLVAFFVYWPMTQLEESRETARAKTQHDRVVAGRQLRGLAGRLLTSESGAVPYYSEWISVDLLGLNSEEIAHEGLTGDILDALSPDLVLTRFEVDDGLKLRPAAGSILTEFLADHQYEVVAVVRKNEEERHVYFAREDSPIYGEMVRRLQSLPAVIYDRTPLSGLDRRIPVHPFAAPETGSPGLAYSRMTATVAPVPPALGPAAW